MGGGIIWVQLEGPLVLCLGIGPPPLFTKNVCQQGMWLGELRIHFQRLLGGTDDFGTHFSGGSTDENRIQSTVRFGQADVGGREGRIFANCPLKVGNSRFYVSLAVAFGKLALEITLINFRGDITRRDKPRLLL